ncbi:MAG: DUF4625 domain-containing protein [Chitinophagales bacterium]|nr:DUF4625 domain-containing protein [Chitinophagales bacterium]
MYKLTLFFSLFALLLFNACDDSSIDTTTPQVAIKSFTPTPIADEICGTTEDSVFVLRGGEQLSFNILFTDDIALSQYKIDIHNNFDCHGHGGSSAPGIPVPNVSNQTSDWTVLDIIELAGQEADINKSLSVPQNVTTGTYHFQIQVLDESGNDNPLANIYSIRVFNPVDEVAPILTTTAPAGSFTVAKGESIQFTGSVTDNYSLSEGGNGILFLSYTDLNSGNTFTTDAAFSFDNSISTNYDFDFSYTVPNTLVSGSYRFMLNAFDGVRNAAEVAEFEVEVE